MDNPVKLAVAPLKTDAIKRAETDALAYLETIRADLAANNWSLDKTCPRPTSRTMSNFQYLAASRKLAIYASVTRWTQPTRKSGEETFVFMDVDLSAKFVADAKATAAAQYEAFVAKLVGKIGACLTAELQGNHVWSYSVLVVEFADKPRQVWKTKQIVNVSKLGKLFNQWPSRKLKVG